MASRSRALHAVGGRPAGKPCAVPVTLSLRLVPDEWAVENGYAEVREDLYRRPNGVYEGRPGIRWLPTSTEDEVLFHFLGGSRAPRNFAKDSRAGRQWTYTGKGRKAADRDLFVSQITRAEVEADFAVAA